MAKNLNQVNGGATTVPTGGRLYIAKPVATPAGFEDYFITYENLVSIIAGLVAGNTANIALESARINVIEAMMSKVRDASQNSSYTFTNYEGSLIEQLCLFWVSGTPEIKIGTTLNGDDILDATTLTSTNTYNISNINQYAISDETIYITITGGTVDVVRYFKKTVNT